MSRVPWLSWLAPARTVPATRWRAVRRWSPQPLTLLVLELGLALFGLGEALIVQGGLGVSPWTVLAQGLSVRTGLTIGWTSLVIGAVVLAMWIPLRERPGPGTVVNIVVISAVLEAGVRTLPSPSGVGWQVLFVLLGVASVGLGSGLYLTCNLGPGPRDGWMTGLHRRTGWPVSRVRMGIEASVLIIGWLLGGTVGIGTVVFALLIGPSVGLGLRGVGHLGGAAPNDTVVDDEFPELDA